MSIVAADITGVVLAGGQGTRMGRLDKGLQLLRGYPMVMHVLARLAPQVGPILVNANQNEAAYAGLGYPVVPDRIGGFAGPLAGVHAALLRCETSHLLSVPCDSPNLPGDLVSRLVLAMQEERSPAAVAVSLGRTQPVFCLMHVSVLASLGAYLDAGGRKFETWCTGLPCALAHFDDQPDAFRNINTLEELRANEHVPSGT